MIELKKNFQPELTAASTTSNSNAESAEGDRSGNGDDDDEADNGTDDTDGGNNSKQDTLSRDESIPMESQSMPGPGDGYPSGDAASAATDSDYPSSQSDAADNSINTAQEQPDNEAAERSEAEAAEAREAEAADRSALDEQQQQQREIIKAQAQSEAIAIREQQEALLRQQNLQQNMLLRRQQSDLRHQQQQLSLEEPLLPARRRMSPTSASKAGTAQAASYNKHQQQVNRPVDVVSNAMSAGYDHDDNMRSKQRSNVSPIRDGVRYMVDPNVHRTYKGNDMLGSRQNPILNPINEANSFDDEIGVDYSVRRPQISAPNEGPDLKNDLLSTTSRQQPINLTQYGDLLPAAQGSYGSLHGGGHHGGYYMWVSIYTI